MDVSPWGNGDFWGGVDGMSIVGERLGLFWSKICL